MALTCVMKQLREKHVSAEISRCLWSPKMDLLALANVQGQVVLHRLSWQPVWTLNPPVENMKVTALAWRMDSKVLSIGYTTGKVLLINIEDSSSIHELDLKEEVSYLTWNKYTSFSQDDAAKSDKQQTQDSWSPYMYPLPALSKSFSETTPRIHSEVWQEPRLLQDQTELNVLCIGTVGCILHLYAFGLFHIATVNVLQASMYSKIVNITPSQDLEVFSVILEREVSPESKELVHAAVHTPIISSRHNELHSLAQKYGQIHSLMVYMRHTLGLIEEAWESTLIETDAKLAAYASTQPEGGVGADFLELLVFGHASADFEVFLTTKLNEKALKKLRQSVDLCYSTMQRLVVRHMQQVAVTLVFLLSQVRGMSRRHRQFGSLGVSESDVEAVIGKVGSFLLKATEMLQAIETSMRDFHVFVRWVSCVHLRLLREHVPADLSRISQQETANLLRFLNESFEETTVAADGERKTHFRLERAGQYLKGEDLKVLSDDNTPLSRLLTSCPSLTSHKLIFAHNPRTSLLQEHQSLTEALTQMGAQPGEAIGGSVEVGDVKVLINFEFRGSLPVAQISSAEGSILSVIVPSFKSSALILIEWTSSATGSAGASPNVRSGTFCFGIQHTGVNTGVKTPFRILDVQFYSPETLSLLLTDPSEPRNPFFAQVGVQNLREKMGEVPVSAPIDHSSPTDVSSLPDTFATRRLETGSACSIAVSGPRKVAAVIGENRRRIRLYEMEAEEEEDIDDETDENTKNESVINASNTTDELNDTL